MPHSSQQGNDLFIAITRDLMVYMAIESWRFCLDWHKISHQDFITF